MAVEILDLPLPRPIRAIHQIEVTSHCNLRCVYCTNPNLARPKVYMDRATFEKALAWAKYFADLGNPEQYEVNLAGIGESTMHPDFVEYVGRARKVLGPKMHLVIATNGLLMTEQLADQLRPFNLKVHVSAHRPEKAGPAVDILNSRGMLEGISVEPTTASIDWAGQVKGWKPTVQQGRPCPWIRMGWAMVMADGRITTCSLDASGAGVVGTVDDKPGSLSTKPYSLCTTCDQEVGVRGYTQKYQLPVLK